MGTRNADYSRLTSSRIFPPVYLSLCLRNRVERAAIRRVASRAVSPDSSSAYLLGDGYAAAKRLLNISSNEIFVIVVFRLLFLLAGWVKLYLVADSSRSSPSGADPGKRNIRNGWKSGRAVRDFSGHLLFRIVLSIDPFSLGGAVG